MFAGLRTDPRRVRPTITYPSDGGWRRKYYIGNASTWPRWSPQLRSGSPAQKSQGTSSSSPTPARARYDLIKNVVNSQNYVAQYALRDCPGLRPTSCIGAEAFPPRPQLTVASASTAWVGVPSECAPALYSRLRGQPSPTVRHCGDRLQPAAAHRRLRAAPSPVSWSPAGPKLHAQRVGRRPSLPAHRSPRPEAKVTSEASGSSPPVGRHCGKGVEGHVFETVAREIGLPGWKAPCTSTSDTQQNSCNYLFAPRLHACQSSRRDGAADDAFLLGDHRGAQVGAFPRPQSRVI